MIGVAVPLSSVSPDFYLQILSGIKKEAEILGYGSMIFDVTTEGAREDFFAKMPFLGIVDGLIVIGLHIDERRLRILEQQRLPVTMVHNRLEQSPVVANVLPASELALRDLIDQHLIRQHGYRRLALVTLGTSNPLKMGVIDRPDWTRAARIQAYEDALQANEIPLDANMIFEVAEHSFAEGYRVFQEIMRLNELRGEENQIEAVVCTSDTLAAAVLTAVRRNNFKMAVTGFDNLPLAELLDITTVEQRAGDVGRQAFRHLYNALVYSRRTGSFPALEEEGIGMQVVIRCSCGCPHLPAGG
jgi:DNA-binding LacI/PurR family transcriptional regulator